MAINRIREMWELVSKTVVNPEVDKLLRATQLFEFVKNPETAYIYIDTTRPMETWVLRCKLYPKQRRGETYGLPDRFREAAGTHEQLCV